MDFDELVNIIYYRINKFLDAPVLAVGILDKENNLNYEYVMSHGERCKSYVIDASLKNSVGLEAILKNKK